MWSLESIQHVYFTLSVIVVLMIWAAGRNSLTCFLLTKTSPKNYKLVSSDSKLSVDHSEMFRFFITQNREKQQILTLEEFESVDLVLSVWYIASINQSIIKTVDFSLINLLRSLAGVMIWLCDAVIHQKWTKLFSLDQQVNSSAALIINFTFLLLLWSTVIFQSDKSVSYVRSSLSFSL